MSESQHTAVMKGVGAAFTPNAVRDYEPFIDQSANRLVEALSARRTFDMGRWFSLFAMDVLNRVAFGESPGFLEKGTDVDDIIRTVQKRFEYWHVWGAIPGIEYVLHKNPIMRAMVSGPINSLARIAQSQLERRRAQKDAPQSHKDLLQKYMNGRARYPDDISETNVTGLAVSSIAAGADTTATTQTSVLFFVLRHRDVLSRLRSELETAVREGTVSHDTPHWTEVHKLPYLDAVIKESMRLWPIFAHGMDRIVPRGGCEIVGTFLPAGTVVACHNEAVHLDQVVYGEDAKSFRPDRWIEADEGAYKRMERVFLGFGAGKRICPGRHIALLEMKKLLSLLVLRFDMRLENPEQDIRQDVKLNTVKYSGPVMATFEERLAL